MEFDDLEELCPPPEAACDDETFGRVWRRVAPEQRPDCPICLSEGAQRAAQNPQHMQQPPQMEGQTPQYMQQPQQMEYQNPQFSPQMPQIGGSAPQYAAQAPRYAPEETPVSAHKKVQALVPVPVHRAAPLAPQREEETPLCALQHWATESLVLARRYAALSRCCASASAVLSGLSAQCVRRARRLAAAYFIASGLQYFPQCPAACQSLPTPMALRAQYFAEEAAQAGFAAAAQKTCEATLKLLLLDLADEALQHKTAVRTILERL